jgi:hypothetical protein
VQSKRHSEPHDFDDIGVVRPIDPRTLADLTGDQEAAGFPTYVTEAEDDRERANPETVRLIVWFLIFIVVGIFLAWLDTTSIWERLR